MPTAIPPPLPLSPPWETPFTPIDRTRIVVVANSDVAWSLSVCEYYCQQRGIPTANIISFAMGTHPINWTPPATTVAWLDANFMLPLKAHCLAKLAVAVLFGPGCPLRIVINTGGGNFPTMLHRHAQCCMGWPPIPLNDLSKIVSFGSTEVGHLQQQNIVAPTTITKAVDVTAMVDEIRQEAMFASGNRLNVWLSPASPLVSASFDIFSNTNPPRLTVVQGGVTVYDQAITLNTEDGNENVGGIWTSGLLVCQDITGAGSGDQPNDKLGTISFANVTINPAVAVESATLTVTTDHSRVNFGGDIIVYGESQALAAATLWSNTHKPIGSAVPRVPSTGTFSLLRDLAEIGANYYATLADNGINVYGAPIENGWHPGPNFLSASNPTGAGYVNRYQPPFNTSLDGAGNPADPGQASIFVATDAATRFLGTSDFYANSADQKGAQCYPLVPFGRIGLACVESYNGGLPAVETEAIARAIIDRATAAMAAHDVEEARLKPILFHAAIDAGYANFTGATMYFYHLCRNVWGMSGARYAYAQGAATSALSAEAESYAPAAGGLYTQANISALPYILSDTVRQPFYMMLGNWLNLSTDAPYSAPYSTSWLPMPGAGGMSGPSQGWQYAMQALYGGGAACVTDERHIGQGSMWAHLSTFYNLLRGMSWLEAAFWGRYDETIVIGDPLWAPYGLPSADPGPQNPDAEPYIGRQHVDMRTGFKARPRDLKREWTGLLVTDPEPRHPLDFAHELPIEQARGSRAPEPPDTFLSGSSGMTVTTYNFTISDDLDDGAEIVPTFHHVVSESYLFNLTGSTDASGANDHTVCWSFPDVQSYTCTSATLTLEVTAEIGASTFKVRGEKNNATSSTRWSTTNQPSTKYIAPTANTGTSATSAAITTAPGTKTIDVTAIVQEIMASPFWNAGRLNFWAYENQGTIGGGCVISSVGQGNPATLTIVP